MSATNTTSTRLARPRYERWTIILGLVGLAAVCAPSTLFLLFALLPTLVTAMLEQNPRRSVTIAVGATNLAGAVPGLLHLWHQGGTMDRAIELLNDPARWGWAYAGAMAGGLIAAALPKLVAHVMAGTLERRVNELEQRQKQLTAQWGI
ncbi:MAG: hypothetical protein JWM77_815 [Rhodospirillales bacterium]|jgi:hypothetical protein|nr:hypothetical protein [Rhodospirillales bacterium]